MGQRQVGLRLDEDLFRRVEAARGWAPRNRWIREALEAALDDGGSPVTGTADIGGPAVAAPPSPASPRASVSEAPEGKAPWDRPGLSDWQRRRIREMHERGEM